MLVMSMVLLEMDSLTCASASLKAAYNIRDNLFPATLLVSRSPMGRFFSYVSQAFVMAQGTL